jgi:hypothetical protein
MESRPPPLERSRRRGTKRQFLCSARGRAFVRSARERRDMGRGPLAQILSIFRLFFFLKVFLVLVFTNLLAFFFPPGFSGFAERFSNF